MSDSPSRLRITLRGLSLFYFALVAIVWVLQAWWAERFIALWVLLFLPVSVWLIPMAPLALYAAWKRRWHWVGLYAGCALVVMVGVSRFRVRFGGGEKGEFTVISHNIGQGDKLAFSEAFPGLAPDAILLQDANYREKDYARRYPHMRVRGVAQFIVLTPHELVEAALVPEMEWRGKSIAARYVVRTPQRSIVLYNIHFPTPRQSLRAAVRPRGLAEMFAFFSAPTDGYPSYRAWLDARVALYEKLAERISRETLPVVIAGDFNTPDRGQAYRAFASRFTDAHVASGVGWGHTFPGAKDGHLARLLGSWLRLDYVFAGSGWKVVDCRVASDASSQHRAISASLAFAP